MQECHENSMKFHWWNLQGFHDILKVPIFHGYFIFIMFAYQFLELHLEWHPLEVWFPFLHSTQDEWGNWFLESRRKSKIRKAHTLINYASTVQTECLMGKRWPIIFHLFHYNVIGNQFMHDLSIKTATCLIRKDLPQGHCLLEILSWHERLHPRFLGEDSSLGHSSLPWRKYQRESRFYDTRWLWGDHSMVVSRV